MAVEELRLVPASIPGGFPATYRVNFGGTQHQIAGLRYKFGNEAVNGPVAVKSALDAAAVPLLRRETDVARFLDAHGGELLSRCIAYDFDSRSPSTLVTHRGLALAELARDPTRWPLGHAARSKLVTDLLQGLEVLRVARVVHGAVSMNTLFWDGSTLLLTDFGHAALGGTYPDGRTAHHGDDIMAAARVTYEVLTGEPLPADPTDLRHQIEQVSDSSIRDLLLRRDPAAGRDIDYAFASEPERRPSARELLDRLDRRPHGVRPEQLEVQDEQIRAEFRQLRAGQRHFQSAYHSWLSQQMVPAFWPALPTGHPVAQRTMAFVVAHPLMSISGLLAVLLTLLIAGVIW